MMFKDLASFEAFLETRKSLGIKPGLTRMKKMAKMLDHPERQNKFIHVAGTNGKGSTIHFIKSALVSNDYRVAVFSSPSFYGVRGYYQLDDRFIDDEILLKQANKIYPVIKTLDLAEDGPTEFEIVTMLSFLVFQNHADFVLLETGMGGREDTTNIVDPIISVITNVTFDHQQFLGEKIEEIATHKAGIIKDRRPVVVGNLTEPVGQIVAYEAGEKNSPLYRYGFDFYIRGHGYYSQFDNQAISLNLNLKGKHQYHNASLALTVLHLLEKGDTSIDWQKANQAMNKTFIPGRFETLKNYPWLTLDSAHNADAIKYFIETVNLDNNQPKRILIFAGFRDKAVDQMLEQLIPTFDKIYLTTFEHPRAAAYAELQRYLQNNKVAWLDDWQSEITNIIEKPESQASYYVTGSLDFITKVRNFIIKD